MRLKHGYTLAEIMVAVAILSLLLAVAIPSLLRARTEACQNNAQAVLRSISAVLENYAVVNKGQYPESFNPLLVGTPPYLNENYVDGQPRQKYTFSCDFGDPDVHNSYSCTATPVPGFDGKVYHINTGGVLGEGAGTVGNG